MDGYLLLVINNSVILQFGQNTARDGAYLFPLAYKRFVAITALPAMYTPNGGTITINDYATNLTQFQLQIRWQGGSVSCGYWWISIGY